MELGLDAVMVPAGNYTGLIKEREWSPDSFMDRFGVVYKVMESSWPLELQ